MKKVIILSVAVLLVVSSLVAGVFAAYQTKLNDVGAGASVAKAFVLTGEAADTFTTDAKIAPGETVSTSFTVQNYDDNYTTETDMALNVQLTLAAAEGKTAIPTLTATMKDENGNVVATGNITNGVGTLTLDDPTAFTANNKAIHTYDVTITWPNGDNATDIQYQGVTYGTAYTVDVVGTQVV